jgi:SAM-dependent methyltransferase
MKYTWKDTSQYIELYSTSPDYGSTGTHSVSSVSAVIKDNLIESVFDFGCGTNYSLIKGLKELHPNTKFFGYDPAILNYQNNEFVSNEIDENLKVDMVVSTDCIEHIPENELPQCWKILRDLQPKIIFLVICCRIANKILPDGTNAHKSVKSPLEWKSIVQSNFLDYRIMDFNSSANETYCTIILINN